MDERRRQDLAQLTEAVAASRKYRFVSSALIHNIGARELAHAPNLKAAIKETKNKLHQVGAAYQEHDPHYAAWLTELRSAAQTADPLALRAVCRSVMAHHASTRERLPILEEFYGRILADLPPVHSVLDLACGLNPLSLPWLPFDAQTRYYACDIYADMVDFVRDFLALLPIQGQAEVCDLLQDCPTQSADLALILKTLPCLEQVEPAAGRRLLERLNTRYLLVSFPARSLGGRSRGMVAHYEARFSALVAELGWKMRRYEFATELAFLVTR